MARGTQIDGQMADLADRINSTYDALCDSARAALKCALECGELLLQAKARLEHGEWLSWLMANTKVSVRQSQKLMRLAQHADEVLANANPSSHFTINGALVAISTGGGGDLEGRQAEGSVEKPRYPEAKLPTSRDQRRKVRRLPTSDNDALLRALKSDLRQVHNRGEAGRILQAIATVCETGISPRMAAAQFKDDDKRQAFAQAAGITVAWLHDFQIELQKPVTISGRPYLRLVCDASPEDTSE